MTTSSFEEFVWNVPGYRFILNDDEKEVPVPVPEIADADVGLGVVNVASN